MPHANTDILNPLLSKDQLNHIIFGHPVNDSGVKVHYSNQGPAAFDPWLGLVNADPNPWLHTEQPDVSHAKKPRVIVCEPLEGFRPVGAFPIVFFATLFQHYEVYFWAGAEGSMRYARPLANVEEFWEGKRLAPIATAEVVKGCIANEGLSPHDYLIIDHEKYTEILRRNIQSLALDDAHVFIDYVEAEGLYNQSVDTLTMLKVSRSLVGLTHALPVRQIKKLVADMLTEDEILVLDQFPNLETVEIHHASQRWVEACLKYFNGMEVVLKNFHTEGNATIPSTVKLKSLSIQGMETAKLFSVAEGAHLESLAIIDGVSTQVDLTGCKGLRSLNIILCATKKHPLRLILAKDNRIESLTLYSTKYVRIPFQHLNALNELTLTYPEELPPFGPATLDRFLACLLKREPKANLLLPHLKRLRLGRSYDDKGKRVIDLRGREALTQVSCAQLSEWEVLASRNLSLVETPKPPQAPYPVLHSRVTARYFSLYGDYILKRLKDKKIELIASNNHTDNFNPGQALSYLSISNSVRVSERGAEHLRSPWVMHCEASLQGDAENHLLIHNQLRSLKLDMRDVKKPMYEIRAEGGSSLVALNINAVQIKEVTIDLAHCTELLYLNVSIGGNQLKLLNVDACTKLKNVSIIAANHVPYIHAEVPRFCHVDIKKESPAAYLDDTNIACALLACRSDQAFNECITAHPKFKMAFTSLGYLLLGGISLSAFSFMLYLVIETFDHYTNTPSPTPSPTESETHPEPTPESGHGYTVNEAILWGSVGGAVFFGAVCFLVFCYRDKIREALAALNTSLGYNDEFDIEQGIIGTSKNDDANIKHDCFSDSKTMFENSPRVRVKHVVKMKCNGTIQFFTGTKHLAPVPLHKQTYINSDEPDFLAMKHRVLQEQQSSIYYLNGDLIPNKLYPIPTHLAVFAISDLEAVFVDRPKAIELLYSRENQLPYVKLKRGARHDGAPVNVKLYLEIKHPPKVFAEEGEVYPALYQVNDRLLPKKLKNAIKALIASTGLGITLNDDDSSLAYKMEALKLILKSATNEDQKAIKPLTLENLAFSFSQKTLSVTDACKLFVLIAQSFDVPAALVSTKAVVYVEYPVVTNEGHTYQAWHVVGASHRLAKVIAEEPKNKLSLLSVFGAAAKQLSGPTRLQLAEAAARKKYESEARNAYQHCFTLLLSMRPLRELYNFLSGSGDGLSPLLQLDEALSALDLNAELIRRINTEFQAEKQHYYAHTPSELKLALMTNRIEGGVLLEDQDGPLLTLFRECQETFFLVVNLDKFTPRDLAWFQSSLEDQPYFTVGDRHIVLPKNAIVVCLTHALEKLSVAFRSRTIPWKVTAAFMHPSSARPLVQLADAIPVDLFGLPAWREKILGEINFVPDGLELLGGPLLKAITTQAPLVIHNPPPDDALMLLMNQVNEQRKVVVNGKLLLVPSSVYISTEVSTHENSLDSIDWVASSNIDRRAQRVFVLGVHNFYQMLDKQVVDGENGEAITRAGSLSNFNPASDVIELVGRFPQAYWSYLIYKLNQDYPRARIVLALSPDTIIEGVDQPLPLMQSPTLLAAVAIPNNGEHVLASNDVDWLVARMKHEDDNLRVFHLTPETTLSELLFSVTYVKQSQRPFQVEKQGLLQAIQGEHPVLLVGEPKTSLYCHLRTMLSDSPYVLFNNKRIPVVGLVRLIISSEFVSNYPQCDGELRLTPGDYQAMLQTVQGSETNFQNLLKFFDAVDHYPHDGRGRPPRPKINFYRLQNMLAELARDEPSHKANPIKGYISYQYPRNSEDQAYVNVMAKYFLAPAVNQDQCLMRFRLALQTLHVKDKPSLMKVMWSILGLWTPTQIRTFLGPDLQASLNYLGYPRLNEERLNALLAHCMANMVPVMPVQSPKFSKNQRQLSEFMQSPEKRIAFIKGLPGVSKTFSVRNFIGRVYEGEAGLIDYLQAKSIAGEAIVYLKDEVNTLLPGHLDYLVKAIGCGFKSITLPNGVTYPLSVHHKLIATGNPEDYPKRYFHQAFIDHAVIIYFDQPEDEFLLDLVKQQLPVALHEQAQYLLAAYHLVGQHNIYFHASIRDIQSLANQFLNLVKAEKASDTQVLNTCVLRAALAEFAGAIPVKENRDAYLAKLAHHLGLEGLGFDLPRMMRITDDVYLPREKHYLLYPLLLMLDFRMQALIEQELNPSAKKDHDLKPVDEAFFKQLVILQGVSGLGKSRILRAVVELHRELTAENIDKYKLLIPDRECLIAIKVMQAELDKPIYDFSMGAANVAMILQKANADGCIVICDESNIDSSTEGALSRLLETNNTGFMCFCSQNGTEYEGRLEASPAFVSRSLVIYMDKFSREERLAIAEHANIPCPSIFVDVFEAEQEKSSLVNMRSFYTALRNVSSGAVELMPYAFNQALEQSLSSSGEEDVRRPFMAV